MYLLSTLYKVDLIKHKINSQGAESLPSPINNKQDQNTPPHPVFDWRPIFFTLITFIVYYSVLQREQHSAEPIAYSTFKDMVIQGSIAVITLKGHEITGLLTNNTIDGKERSFISIIPEINDPTLIPLLEKYEVEITAKSGEPSIWLNILFSILPWILIFGFFAYSNRALQSRMGGDGGPFSFSKSKAKLYTKMSTHIGFDEVAGLESAKEELREVIEYLTKPEKFRKLGAKLPRGILMMGPPGTGKTLLAKATAS